MEKKRSILKTIFFSIIPLLVLVICIELILRVVYFQRNNNEKFAITALIKKINNRNIVEVKSKRCIRLREHVLLLNNEIIPRVNEITGVENLQKMNYNFATDKNGFILPANNYTNPDISIVFIGGSTTECSFVKDSLRFPYLVSKNLEKELHFKINTYNSGFSGSNTYHFINLLLNKIVPLKPQYAVLMENINDWTTLLFEGTYFNQNPTRSLIMDPNIKNALNDDEWAHLRGKKIDVKDSFILNEFKKAQLTFIQICKINNIQPVLMTQASRYKEIPDIKILEVINKNLSAFNLDYKTIRSLQLKINELIRTNATENNLLLIDLEKEIPQTKEYMYDIVHYNENGSKLASQIIAKKLIGKIKYGNY